MTKPIVWSDIPRSSNDGVSSPYPGPVYAIQVLSGATHQCYLRPNQNDNAADWIPLYNGLYLPIQCERGFDIKYGTGIGNNFVLSDRPLRIRIFKTPAQAARSVECGKLSNWGMEPTTDCVLLASNLAGVGINSGATATLWQGEFLDDMGEFGAALPVPVRRIVGFVSGAAGFNYAHLTYHSLLSIANVVSFFRASSAGGFPATDHTLTVAFEVTLPGMSIMIQNSSAGAAQYKWLLYGMNAGT